METVTKIALGALLLVVGWIIYDRFFSSTEGDDTPEEPANNPQNQPGQPTANQNPMPSEPQWSQGQDIAFAPANYGLPLAAIDPRYDPMNWGA